MQLPLSHQHTFVNTSRQSMSVSPTRRHEKLNDEFDGCIQNNLTIRSKQRSHAHALRRSERRRLGVSSRKISVACNPRQSIFGCFDTDNDSCDKSTNTCSTRSTSASSICSQPLSGSIASKSQRRVQFNNQVAVSRIATLNHYTKAEVDACWYTQDEYNEIKRDASVTLYRAKRCGGAVTAQWKSPMQFETSQRDTVHGSAAPLSMPLCGGRSVNPKFVLKSPKRTTAKVQASRSPSPTSRRAACTNSTKNIYEFGYEGTWTMRGLEYCHEAAQRTQADDRKAIVQMVLFEQARQQLEGEDDREHLARLYEDQSIATVRKAVLMGHHDAESARKINRGSSAVLRRFSN